MFADFSVIDVSRGLSRTEKRDEGSRIDLENLPVTVYALFHVHTALAVTAAFLPLYPMYGTVYQQTYDLR